jgi:hypothetical protein
VLTKISAKTAAEVCGLYGLSTSAQKLLRADLTPQQFVEMLFQAGLYVDAFDFLAHALPKRDAIWWACLGVRHALGSTLPPEQFAALKAAVEWVLEPDEPKRRAAQAAAQTAGYATPAACAAVAVFGSGGSLGPGNFPDVPPEPTMTAQAVSRGIILASVRVDSRTITEVQRELVELGIAIAEGRITWPAATKTAGKPAVVGRAPGQRF